MAAGRWPLFGGLRIVGIIDEEPRQHVRIQRLHGLPRRERVRATLNKSLAARSSLFWAVCGVANPRHSWAMAVVCALQPIPNQDAHTREDLFSIA